MKIKIFGKEYDIKGDTSSEYIKEVASSVNSRMEEISKLAPGKSSFDIAVLAALNIADELTQERRVNKDYEKKAEKSLLCLNEVLS